MEIEYSTGGAVFGAMVVLMVVSAIGTVAGVGLLMYAIYIQHLPLVVGGVVDLTIWSGFFVFCWMWFTEPVE